MATVSPGRYRDAKTGCDYDIGVRTGVRIRDVVFAAAAQAVTFPASHGAGCQCLCCWYLPRGNDM